ncbi:hypothetical protein R3P38DRAFT_3351310, partial [Favolaschia claudopus]
MYRLGYTPSQLRMAGLDKTLGMLLIGALVSAALYGVGCLQAWHYYQKFKGDSALLKALVAFVIVIDTCQQALVAACVYTYLVTNFSNIQILDRVVPTLIIEVFFAAFIALAVQLFYCYRFYSVSDSPVAAGILALVIVGAFATEIVFALKAMTTETFAELE